MAADDQEQTTDFEQLAEWLSNYVTPIRVTVFAWLPAAGGGVMAGPMALDIYLPRPYDAAGVLEHPELSSGFAEGYLALPYDGGQLVIDQAQFEYASNIGHDRIIVYMLGGVGITFSEDTRAS